MLTHRLDEQLPLVDRQCGFLALYVFTGLNCQDANQRVPMIGRGNHHRINVLAREDFAKILGRETILVLVAVVDCLLRAKQAIAVHVARRHHLRVLVAEIRAEIPIHAMITRADEANRDAVVG
jgi:hypothetical protein